MTTEKPVTVTQLKTFIDAVEFAADAEDWIPSERQWKRIRSMIERLEETAESLPPPAARREQLVEHSAQTFIMPQVPASAFGNGQFQPPAQLRGPFSTGGPSPVRTPDVDSSDGSYNSSFV